MPPKTQEPKRDTLPVNHPQAGYVTPDRSFQEGWGTVPDDEQKAHDERDQAREAEVEAVAASEDKAAKAEFATREKRDGEHAKAKTSEEESKPRRGTS